MGNYVKRFVLLCAVVLVWATIRADDRRALDTSEEGMEAISNALGVACQYCHPSETEDGTRDYKAPSPHKETALYMNHHFVNRLVTTTGQAIDCAYCHAGAARFVVRDTSADKPSRLAGMSRGDIVAMMKAMQTALGVKACDYCHVRRRDGRLDSVTPTANKVVARMMMERFTDRLLDIQTGKPATCQTCHAGKAKFLDRREGTTDERR